MVHVFCTTCGLDTTLVSLHAAASTLCRRCLSSLAEAPTKRPHRKAAPSAPPAPARPSVLPSPIESSEDWRSVHQGLLGLRRLLRVAIGVTLTLMALALPAAVIVIVVTMGYASPNSRPPPFIEFVFSAPGRYGPGVAMVVMVGATAYALWQLFRLTRVPGPKLRVQATLAFWASLVLVLVLVATSGNSSLMLQSSILPGLVVCASFSRFLLLLARATRPDSGVGSALALMFLPVVLLPLMSLLFGDIGLLKLAILSSLAGVVLLQSSLTKLAEALERPQSQARREPGRTAGAVRAAGRPVTP